MTKARGAFLLFAEKMKERGMEQSTAVRLPDHSPPRVTDVAKLKRLTGRGLQSIGVNTQQGTLVRTGKAPGDWKRNQHLATPTPIKTRARTRKQGEQSVPVRQPPNFHFPYPIKASRINRVVCVMCSNRCSQPTTCAICMQSFNRKIAFCSSRDCFIRWHTEKTLTDTERAQQLVPMDWSTNSGKDHGHDGAAPSTAKKRRRDGQSVGSTLKRRLRDDQSVGSTSKRRRRDDQSVVSTPKRRRSKSKNN